MTFEAHHAEHNHHRRYQITLGRDLLDEWTVGIQYGRCGQTSQERRFASPQSDAVRAVLRRKLQRRLSAPQRIGCAYRLAAWQTAPGFDAAAWLPKDALMQFLSQR